MRRFLVALLMVATVSTWAWAGPVVTLNFGELPFQPVNGLSYMGVTFGFKVGGSPSSDANYNAGGPGVLTYVQDPSLEGNARGILTLDFAFPTSILSFGAALDTYAPLSPGFVVTLYDSGLNWIEDGPVSTNPLITFSEGWYNYSGTPVGRASIAFDFSQASRFALDNLTYEIPEPTTFALFGLGLLGVAILRRRRA